MPRSQTKRVLQNIEEYNLICRVKARNEQAFEELYTHYGPRLQAYLTRRFNSRELAEETLNDVMLIFWEQADRCPADVPLMAWLYGIARYQSLKNASRSKGSTLNPAEFVAEEKAPEFHLLAREQVHRLKRAISALPRHERQPIELLVYHGCSYKEIGSQLDISINTIRTRIKRARERLAATFLREASR